MASNSVLQPVPAGGRLQGYGNLARKENGTWWRTRMWLVQILIWGAIVNGILAMVLWSTPAGDPAAAQAQSADKLETALTLFFIMGTLAPAVGVVIIGQDAIIQEKQSGTAAWVLSKPISRSAFVLSKLSAHALGILVTMVLIQGAIAYGQISAAVGQPLPLLPWLGALGLLYLQLVFYLALTLMLGTIFSSRGAVIGIPMAVLFGYQFILGLLPRLGDVLPYVLTLTLGPTRPALAMQLVQNQPLGSLLPIALTVAWIILFIGIAIWRFGREEF